MPKHIRRLLLVIVTTGVALFAAKLLLTDTSFGRFGHYRADSVPEIASQSVRLKSIAYCQQCHAGRVNFWKQGVHHTVKCEVCHGLAAGHPENRPMPLPKQTVSLCGSCHEALPARPATSIKQVVIKEHMGEQACIECHNPHAPNHFTWEDIQGLSDLREEQHG